jgi:hypothetical protein
MRESPASKRRELKTCYRRFAAAADAPFSLAMGSTRECPCMIRDSYSGFGAQYT